MSIISDTLHYFRGQGRFRDVVVSPDGMKIYIACDSSGSTSGPTGGVTTTPANPGSILEFTFEPGGFVNRIEQPVIETLKPAVDIYPNPAHNYFIVYNYAQVPNASIEVVDMTGKINRRIKTSSMATRVECGQLANGVYIVTLKDAT